MGVVGSTEPRVFTPPLRELTPDTSWGYDVAWFAEHILGEPLTEWQQWLAIHALEILPLDQALALQEDEASRDAVRDLYDDRLEPWQRGIPRFKTILVLVARQNGKTHWAKALLKWALFRKRLPYILGAAQTKNDAHELWEEITTECEANPAVKKRMRKPTWAHGFEALRTKKGTGVYKIAGLDRNAGRGKTANLLYLDELREHKSWTGWSALSSTTMSPMVGMNVATSNAGDARSVVLKSLRSSALRSINSGDTSAVTMGIFEWSAEPGLDIEDRDGWAQANPDLGHGRMTERDVLAELHAKDPDVFRTENLCQWVESLEPGKIDPDQWERLTDPDSRPADDTPIFCGVDVATEGAAAHVVIAAERPDGRWHLEVVASRSGYRWVPAWLAARQGSWFSGTVGLQIKGSASNALHPLLEDAGIEVAPWQGTDMSSSVLGFFTAIQEGSVRHLGRDPQRPEQPTLLEAAAVGVKDRKSGDTFIWDRDKSTGDATPLVASNIAWWMGHRKTDEFVSAYSDDGWDDVDDDDDDTLDDFDDDDLLIV